ncbi:Coatomer subunit zeta-1 [Papilio machaon]|uniref:Coatomer subunit zeta n=1 Tax=Papilio machaon TaxID=76193 RepID=A0A194QZW4_PAPMA|nr:Coatomer subunit zeta-1 [Papilio machaon]
MVHTTMEGSLFEPTLYIVKGMCILDNEGNRILAKYYDKNILTTTKEQKAFEKNLFNKTHSSHENELILQSVLNALYESVSILLRRNVEKRVIMENLDSVMLAFDEICDGGVILDSDPTSIVGRAALRTEDVPLGEQTVAQVHIIDNFNKLFW